jgi:hypothetical protein
MITKPLTIKDVAGITGFHPQSVMCAIRNKKLKATLYGHTYLIWPTDLAEYVRNHPRPSRVAHVNLEVLR